MAGRVRAAALGAMLTMLGGCAAAPAPEVAEAADPAPVAVAATPLPVPWPDIADCRALVSAVLAMPEEERRRLRPDASPLALVMTEGPLLLTPDEVVAAIELDLPVPVAEKTGEGRCLVAAGRPRVAPGGGRRLVGHELVRSEYRVRTRRTVNPDYARLREEAGEQAGRDAGRVMATGDPSLDLIGLVGGTLIRGVNRLRAGRGDAAEQLARTERYLETPVYEPYTYEINALEVGRVGVLDIALLDRGAGRAYDARHTVRDRRTFAVAEGRHRADRGVLEGTGVDAVLPEAVAVYETTAPRPRLSDLLQVLAQTRGEGRAADAEAVLASLAAVPAAPSAPAARSASSVTVETLSGPTEATWLDAQHLLVPSTALGRSSLVQVTGPDGMRTFGMVEKVDHGTGQAVVRVSRPGGGERLSEEALESVLRSLKSP